MVYLNKSSYLMIYHESGFVIVGFIPPIYRWTIHHHSKMESLSFLTSLAPPTYLKLESLNLRETQLPFCVNARTHSSNSRFFVALPFTYVAFAIICAVMPVTYVSHKQV